MTGRASPCLARELLLHIEFACWMAVQMVVISWSVGAMWRWSVG